jgi:hypothetical protein
MIPPSVIAAGRWAAGSSATALAWRKFSLPRFYRELFFEFRAERGLLTGVKVSSSELVRGNPLNGRSTVPDPFDFDGHKGQVAPWVGTCLCCQISPPLDEAVHRGVHGNQRLRENGAVSELARWLSSSHPPLEQGHSRLLGFRRRLVFSCKDKPFFFL